MVYPLNGLKYLVGYLRALSWGPYYSYSLYVNDLPSEVSSFCKLFADDAKLYKDLQNLEDFEMIRNDI